MFIYCKSADIPIYMELQALVDDSLKLLNARRDNEQLIERQGHSGGSMLGARGHSPPNLAQPPPNF